MAWPLADGMEWNGKECECCWVGSGLICAQQSLLYCCVHRIYYGLADYGTYQQQQSALFLLPRRTAYTSVTPDPNRSGLCGSAHL